MTEDKNTQRIVYGPELDMDAMPEQQVIEIPIEMTPVERADEIFDIYLSRRFEAQLRRNTVAPRIGRFSVKRIPR